MLTAAGERALAGGDTDVAVDLLRRALDEAPAAPELLLALGLAEARLGLPAADEHLAGGRELARPAVAARAEQARARVLVLRAAPPAAEVRAGAIARAAARATSTTRSAGRARGRTTSSTARATTAGRAVDAPAAARGVAAEPAGRAGRADRIPTWPRRRRRARPGCSELALRALADGALCAGRDRAPGDRTRSRR